MFCNSCGSKMDEADRFCPACGAKREPIRETVPSYDDAVPMRGVEPTMEYGAEPTKEYGADATKEYVPADTGAAVSPEVEPDIDNRTVVIDAYDDPRFYQSSYAEPINRDRQSVPAPQKPKHPVSYQDSFTMQNTDSATEYRDAYSAQNSRFGSSGWEDRSRSSRKQVHPTTAGRRFGSIIMVLMFLLFAFSAMMIGATRLALEESNVRRAYEKGTQKNLTIETKDGKKSFATIIMEYALGTTDQPSRLDNADVDRITDGNIDTFGENLVVDFTQFFVFGRSSSMLNSQAITGYFQTVGDEIREQTGYSIDTEALESRINGGDLSFLNVGDSEQFRQKYGFDPKMISSAFSVWAMWICAGLALLCVVMIFVINHGNLAAGMSFNATAMIIFGIWNTLIAAGLLALSYIKSIFLLSELLRSFALAMGAVSVSVLVVGMVFAVIKTVIRNRI